MTTGKTVVLTRQTFVGKVMSLLFNKLSRLVITFLPRSKHLLNTYKRGTQKLNTDSLRRLTGVLVRITEKKRQTNKQYEN